MSMAGGIQIGSTPESIQCASNILCVCLCGKKYHGDGDYITKWDSIVLDKDLQYKEEPIVFLDRDVHKLRTNEIKSVKV